MIYVRSETGNLWDSAVCSLQKSDGSQAAILNDTTQLSNSDFIPQCHIYALYMFLVRGSRVHVRRKKYEAWLCIGHVC